MGEGYSYVFTDRWAFSAAHVRRGDLECPRQTLSSRRSTMSTSLHFSKTARAVGVATSGFVALAAASLGGACSSSTPSNPPQTTSGSSTGSSSGSSTGSTSGSMAATGSLPPTSGTMAPSGTASGTSSGMTSGAASGNTASG